MTYKKPTPIAKLIKNILHTETYHKHYLQTKLLETFTKALPFTKGQIDTCYLKKNVLYLKINSPLLAHELRLNKAKIIKLLQETWHSAEEKTIPQNIVFV